MKLIVGLGNPGKEYENTRHNVGFKMLDVLSSRARFALDKKFEAEICKVSNFLFVKPQTFMNDSGRSVRKIMDFFKIGVEELVLIHDDLDLKLGDYKIQKMVGPKVHNGVNSVEVCVGNRDFMRLRLGIDGRENLGFVGSGADYVLGKFSKEEAILLADIMDEAGDELLVALGL